MPSRQEGVGWQSVIRWGGGWLGRKKESEEEARKNDSSNVNNSEQTAIVKKRDSDDESAVGMLNLETQYFPFDDAKTGKLLQESKPHTDTQRCTLWILMRK